MPNTIAENLQRLVDAKPAIGNAIIAKGGTVGVNDGLEDFAADIATIPSGGDSGLVDLIERDITSIDIPSSVTGIGDYAFYRCPSLTSVTIPSSVTSIGSNAFGNCPNLTTITINKASGSISGSPWGATNATVTWTG